MSWYFNYSLGVQTNNKIYPLLFTPKGDRLDAVSNSRSFEPENLHYDFRNITDENVTDELKKAYGGDEYWKETLNYLSYLPLSELPSGSYIKKGYFLIEDVGQYEAGEDHYDFDGFYEHLSPQVYAAKLKNEIALGAPVHTVDEDGFDVTEHSARDYMFYAYPDYMSAEYVAAKIRTVAAMFSDYDLEKNYGKDAKLVVILSQG